MQTRVYKLAIVGSLALLFLPAIARAQLSDQASSGPSSDQVLAEAQATQGPMVVTRVQSGFLVAPEFKVTNFDNKVSGLAGFSAGWLHDQTFFIGGGAYFLTDWSSTRELGYGGLVLGWSLFPEERVGISLKGLIGGGIATRASTIIYPAPPLRPYPINNHFNPYPPIGSTVNAIFYDDVFVTEPEMSVVVKLRPNLRLTGSIGYRVTAGGADLSTNVSGATGSVALQIGGGS
jgi:hypothetical protein